MESAIERIDATYTDDTPTYSIAIVSMSSLSVVFSEIGEPQPTTTLTIGFFTRDPIGFAAGDANLYRYTGNSPTNATDPSGLETWWEKLFGRPLLGLGDPYMEQYAQSENLPAFLAKSPNRGRGRGNFHYSENSITFRVGDVKDCDALENAIYISLKSFKHFNNGANDVATIELNRDGTEAYFNALGIMGTGSDAIGNADKTPVGLMFDDENRMVMAHTLEGHMLEGKRYWTVSVKRGPYCDADVNVMTFAYDRKVGFMNGIGAAMMGTAEQLAIWDQYLINVMNANKGNALQKDWPYDRPGPRHHDRDTKSPIMPAIPGYPWK